MIIDQQLLDELTAQASASPRLRMNLNFHQSLEDKCHRMLNAVEPGSDIPVHRHPDKDESFVVLRGKVRSTTYNDDGSVIESVVLCQEDGLYGVDIPKGVWHKLESLESGSVVFECKEGPFVPHEIDGILELPKK
jgi:cupin fold WbuC family metalloprotein